MNSKELEIARNIAIDKLVDDVEVLKEKIDQILELLTQGLE